MPALNDTPLAAASPWLDGNAVLGPQRWSWRQVHVAALALARELRPGASVCNLCATRAGFLVVWLAALRRGCVQVLPPSGGTGDLVAILQSGSDPVVVVDDAALLESAWSEHARCLVHVLRHPENGVGDAELAWTPDPDAPLIRLYTSGSTGTPEVQQKTIGQLASGAQVLAARLREVLGSDFDKLARIVCSVAPQHMFGLETSVMLPLITGIPVHDGRPLLPADVSAAFAGEPGPAAWIATPLHLRALAQAGEQLEQCRLVIASTMQLAPALAEQCEALVRAPVLEIYGSTETGAVAMRRTAREPAWRGLQGVRFESSTGGTTVWGSHFDSPRVLSDRIEAEADGSFLLLGRDGDLLKIAGRRASLGGLNLLLQDMPGLEDGVFFLPASDSSTQRLVLIYAGADFDRRSAFAWLRARMDPVFLPRAMIHVERLPRSAAGKLPRAALEEIYAAHRAGRRAP